MAEGDKPEEDRTEAATPRRLQRAREEGQVPVSREVVTLAGLAAATAALAIAGPPLFRTMTVRLSVFLSQSHAPELAGAGALRLAAWAAMLVTGPLLLATLLAGIAATLLQTGFLFHGGALEPKLERLSPAAGLRRLLGWNSLVEAGKSLAKLAAIAIVLWMAVAGDVRTLRLLPYEGLPALLAQLGPIVLRLMLAVVGVQLVIAVIDLAWVRFRHGRQLRMSRQDIRDELKETEGDPQIKARIRQLRLQRARRRMLAAVPKATVVITNPTHYAVALTYDRAANAAPRVVAKGVDSMAARIREIAAANGVPMVANPPLARALYLVELDAEIPADHYQAVAEVIAYVWRLRQSVRAVP